MRDAAGALGGPNRSLTIGEHTGMHRIHWQGAWPDVGQTLAIDGDEASHALRAKRLRAGERVEVFDGAGQVAACEVQDSESGRRTGTLALRVLGLARHEPARPRVEVFAATPKGGRVDEMVEGLSEAGAASWTPLVTARTVVEPRAAKLDRLRRIAVESAKQCGRAWVLEIGRECGLAGALAEARGAAIVLADGSAPPYRPGSGADTVRLLIGPEGGWTDDERRDALRAGAVAASFGPHAMRIETAAVVGAAVVLDRHRGGARG